MSIVPSLVAFARHYRDVGTVFSKRPFYESLEAAATLRFGRVTSEWLHMARVTLSKWIDAPPEIVFALWTNVDRMSEWIEGLSNITDLTGPLDQVGTTYVTWFGRISGRNEVLAVDRPRRIRTRLGNWLLRGETEANFVAEKNGTQVRQTFETEGLIPGIAARLFALGSYKGSFKGELNTFARMAEHEALKSKGGS